MFLDFIESLSKVIESIVENPKESAFIIACAVVSNVVVATVVRLVYTRRIKALATTAVALYDIESVALELLKESDTKVTKTALRAFAFEKAGYSTQKFRSEAVKYAEKTEL